MDFPLRMCFLVLLWIELILGITLNAFILATSCKEWMTFKHLRTSDKILNHSLFIYVKVRINKIVPGLLLASLLTSLASSLPFGWYIMNGNNSTNNLLKNSTVQDIIVVQNNTNQYIMYGLGTSLPFTIFCVATFLLIKSLWMHIRQMRSSGMSIRSPSLDTHFRVVKSMVFFLLLNIIFFSSMNVIFSWVLPIGNPWLVFHYILTSAYPFLHSAVLIFYNKKLKQTLLDICHRAVKFTQKQRISAKSSTDFTTGRPHGKYLDC
ncbi:hypothetical protein FKM82_018019 [Ascaphus truei]